MVKAYVADWKKDEVSKLQDFVKSADVVGLVDVSGIGAKQMLDMRASLRGMGVKLRTVSYTHLTLPTRAQV